MQAISSDPIANPNSPEVQSSMADLDLAQTSPVAPIPQVRFPPTPEIDETAVLRVVRGMDPASAARPVLMSHRLLRLLASTSISSQAGGTGLSCLTRLVRYLTIGDSNESILPIFTSAKGINIQAGTDKMRPIGIAQALRLVATKEVIVKSSPRMLLFFKFWTSSERCPRWTGSPIALFPNDVQRIRSQRWIRPCQFRCKKCVQQDI